ncbi:LCP family protein [Cohnella nanjingensis]|uniref:LCP family protein n=1 Tax=Cohnella nanjingensis TaxID=1387779 RepID=A0A7X0RXQ7_9BACL|nr:LCP family protein [Cohnella nanjingensis]MBB6675583.1 LCP family protein [Cohnella nanjingensis]
MSYESSLPPRTRQNGPPPRTQKQQPKKPPRKKRRFLRFLFGLFLMVILGLGAYAVYLWNELDGALKDTSSGATSQTVPSADRAQVKPIAILLLGMDYRPKIGGMNTDVMMVAAFNPQSKTATVVSIPRDSELGMNGYVEQKVNQFYAGFHRTARTKEGLKGTAADGYARDKTREMLEKYFGVQIDYTAVLNFQGFVDVIDKLGGVRVTVDKDMKYVDNADGTNIDLRAGEQTLKGEDALGFVRYRKSNRGTAASSDFERNERQSQVLGAIVDKMKTVGGALKLGGVIDVAGKNLITDIPQEQIKNILKTYYDINREDIRFLPLTGDWKSPYVYLDAKSVEAAKQALAEELTGDGRAKSSASPDASASP